MVLISILAFVFFGIFLYKRSKKAISKKVFDEWKSESDSFLSDENDKIISAAGHSPDMRNYAYRSLDEE